MKAEFAFLRYIEGLVRNLDLMDGAQRRLRIELLKQAINKSKSDLEQEFGAVAANEGAILSARVHRLIAALPNVHKMRAYARMFEDGEPMRRDLMSWANNAEKALEEDDRGNADGLDRETFITERVKELLSLGESWDSESAHKEAEQEWETEQSYKEALGAP